MSAKVGLFMCDEVQIHKRLPTLGLSGVQKIYRVKPSRPINLFSLQVK